MFERFTERAREAVVLAQDEARGLGHNHIGTEHLLLGLLREEDGLAARVLAALGVTLEEARDQVARIIGRGDEVAAGQIPFTPRAKKVLELALREALSLGHNHIGTEHVLLGLVRENEGVGAQVLVSFGADAERVLEEVARLLGGPAGFRVGAPRGGSVRAFRRRQFEYRVDAVAGDEPSEIWLNKRGSEGWELVAILPRGDEWRAVFKRRR